MPTKKQNDVVITVKDTGVGIPEDVKSKLFTPMFTTKAKGQGFGLPVIKRMTEALGGTVTFESQEGKGTTFIVRLPLPKELNGKLSLQVNIDSFLRKVLYLLRSIFGRALAPICFSFRPLHPKVGSAAC